MDRRVKHRNRQARKLGKMFGRPVRLNAKQRSMIAERYAAGAAMAELARDFEVDEATICRALVAQGIKTRRGLRDYW